MLRVVAIGPSQGQYKEAEASESVTPGHIVELSNGGLARKCTTEGNVPAMIAVENDIFGKGIDDDWEEGDELLYQHLMSGHEFYGLVASGASAINAGDYVESAGDGTLQLATGNVDTPAAAATLTIGTSNAAVTFTAVAAGESGNDITVTVLATAADAEVSVTGTDIVITPKTGEASATEVAALVNGDINAAALVSAAAGGTGADNVVPAAAAALTGGAEAVYGPIETAFGIAKFSVNNSGGTEPVRLRVVIV